LRLASSPASNQPCGQPSWTRFSSSHRLPALRRCQPVRLAPRLRPCLRSGLRLTLGNLPTTLVACSCPPALPPAWLAPRLRPCLELVSGSRLLQHIRPEPATSRRLSILWPPSRLGSDLRPSAVPFGLRLFLGPSVSPSVRTCVRSRELRSQAGFPLRACALCFRSTLLPPSGSGARLQACAFRLLPFLPASLLACLSPAYWLSPLRLRSEAALWHAFGLPWPPACACGSVRSSVPVSRLAPFPRPSGKSA